MSEKPGTIVTDNKTFLKIACSNGYIHCLFIQLEGKKKMLIEDFLRGRINESFFESNEQYKNMAKEIIDKYFITN